MNVQNDSPRAAPPLPDTVSSLIPAVAKAHRKLAGSLLEDVGLAAGQEFILMLLWEESPQSQVELTRRLMVEPPTTAKSLARLEKLGLVYRERAEADRRVVLVSLTEKGRALQEPVLAVWSALEERTTDVLTDAERSQLHALLARVLRSLTSGGSNAPADPSSTAIAATVSDGG